MRIFIYDARPFEMKTLEKLKEEYEDEIFITDQQMTMDSLELAKDYDAISVLGYSKADRDVLLKMKEYGIYHLSTRTIGYDHFDVDAAKEFGIHLYNAFYSPNNVADFAVMMMLIMLRKAKISICRALVNDFSLDGIQGREMRSLTVGIIGTGKIGETVIKNLSGFGCKVIAYDPYQKESVKELATYVSLDELYAQSDIISLHIPLTESNYRMINKESIYKMKQGVIIINTARGQLINTEDLIGALEDEHVGGAGIDTLEEEGGVMHVHLGTQIVNNRSLLYLKQFPNVLYTQHYAFYTEEAVESMIRCGVNSVRDGFNNVATSCEIKKH